MARYIRLRMLIVQSLKVQLERRVEDIHGEHATLFKDHYYIKSSDNCDLSRMNDPHNEFKDENMLIERTHTSAMTSKFGLSLDEFQKILGICKQKLFYVCSKQPKSHLDDNVIVS